VPSTNGKARACSRGQLVRGKSVMYLIIGITVFVVIAGIALIAVYKPRVRAEDILTAYQDDGQYIGLSILYPHNGTLFPPEIIAPTFHWKDDNSESDTWLVTIRFQDDKGRMNFVTSEQQF
jgi:hypothetical protein